MAVIRTLVDLHHRFFGSVERAFGGWFLGLLARLVFAAVLFFYFFNSALTKIGSGPLGFLDITDGAYFQILPPVMERYGFDASQVPFVPWGLIVHAGAYSELILPILLVVGLFTRIAALGMIVFVAVQTYVDIAFHGVDEKTAGALFDRFQNSAISDQRALWLFPLVYLAVRGPGLISLDAVLRRGVSRTEPGEARRAARAA